MRSRLSYCEPLCIVLKRFVRTKDSGLLGSDTLFNESTVLSILKA